MPRSTSIPSCTSRRSTSCCAASPGSPTTSAPRSATTPAAITITRCSGPSWRPPAVAGGARPAAGRAPPSGKGLAASPKSTGRAPTPPPPPSAAGGGGAPSGVLADAIRKSFGDFAKFTEQLSNAAATRFGSGWAWLALAAGTLEILSTANQDSPLIEGKIPLLGLDVWEHAYYLRYQNRRPEYIAAWWNAVNWAEVAKRYQAATT